VTRQHDGFEVVTEHPGAPDPEAIRCRHLVFATGYFESPNLLRVPGEDLPHVSHFFGEAHPYWQQRVVVVGGGNSAVEAALELCRVGARVTVVHFLGEFDRGVKPWVLPDIINRVKEGRVAVRWCSRVTAIERSHVMVRREPDGDPEPLPADFVLALTGYSADLTLLRSTGVAVDETSGVPRHAPETMETNVPGVYIAGVLASGFDANKTSPGCWPRGLTPTRSSSRTGASMARGSATISKANPPELPLGGDRLPDIVRPRTRCERDDALARGTK